MIALDSIGDGLRREMVEMVILTEHRPQPAHLPEQPLQRGMALAQFAAKQQAALFCQIEQNGAGFKQAERCAAIDRSMIDDGGDFVVR